MPADRQHQFEDLLREVGDYGAYQRRLVWLFVAPTNVLISWFYLNNLFFVHQPRHWCTVAEVAASNLSQAEQRALVAPSGSVCKRYDVNFSALLLSEEVGVGRDTPLVACDRWEYGKEYYEQTAASKWDLVCDRGHLSSLVLTLACVGSIIGTPIYGTLSDKVGRKPIFFLVTAVAGVSGFASLFAEDFALFLFLRTVNGSLMPSLLQLSYIIVLELVGPSHRTRLNVIINLSWSVGLCSLPLIAYLSRHWVVFGLVTTAGTVFEFLYWKFLPESPRWLQAQKRYAETTRALTKIAHANGRPVDPAELHLKVQRLGERIEKERSESAQDDTALDLIRRPNIRKNFLILTFCCVSYIFAYFGLQMNASNLAGNPFLTFFLLAAAEVPGFLACWGLMERLGRRWSSAGALVLTGAACVAPVLAPGDSTWASVGASLVGKAGAAAAMMAVFQRSSELYPTTIRAVGMGASGALAGLANITLPYVVYLATFGKHLPFLVIGLLCLASGLAASFLPETLDQVLPQTVHDAELFGSDQPYCSCIPGSRPDLSKPSQLEVKPEQLPFKANA